MDTEALNELKALAQAAGGRAWQSAACGNYSYVCHLDGDLVCETYSNIGHQPEPVYNDRVAAYIAAANPAAVLELIAQVESLQAENKKLTRRADNNEGMAASMDMLRQDMIEAGIIEKSVPPMFMTEAMLGHVGKLQSANAVLKRDLGYSKMAADEEAKFADELNAKVKALEAEQAAMRKFLDEANAPTQDIGGDLTLVGRVMALQEELAALKQGEPVGTLRQHSLGNMPMIDMSGMQYEAWKNAGFPKLEVYAAPPAQPAQPSPALTDDDIRRVIVEVVEAEGYDVQDQRDSELVEAVTIDVVRSLIGQPAAHPSAGDKQDAELLDWLQAHPGFEISKFITWRNGEDEYDGVERFYWQVTTHEDAELTGSTLREAIRAAMQQDKEGSKP